MNDKDRNAVAPAQSAMDLVRQHAAWVRALGPNKSGIALIDQTLVDAIVHLGFLNAPIFAGRTPLIQCIKSADYQGALLVLKAGACPNAIGGSKMDRQKSPLAFVIGEYDPKHGNRHVRVKERLKLLSNQLLTSGAVWDEKYKKIPGFKDFKLDVPELWANNEAKVLEGVVYTQEESQGVVPKSNTKRGQESERLASRVSAIRV